jgi:hypothetical protein
VTWLGQNGDGAPLPILTEVPAKDDHWSRSEKILLLGVLVNATYLIYAILRRRDVRSDVVGPSY